MSQPPSLDEQLPAQNHSVPVTGNNELSLHVTKLDHSMHQSEEKSLDLTGHSQFMTGSDIHPSGPIQVMKVYLSVCVCLI